MKWTVDWWNWLLLLQDIKCLKRALYQQQILIHDHYTKEFKMSLNILFNKNVTKYELTFAKSSPLSKQCLFFISLTLLLVIYLHITSCAWATPLHQMGWLQSLFSPLKKIWLKLNSTQKKSTFNYTLHSCILIYIYMLMTCVLFFTMFVHFA